MNWLLFISLLFITIVEFVISKRRTLSSSFVVSVSMLISSFFLAINTNHWQYTISFTTTCTVILVVLFFAAGRHVTYNAFIKRDFNYHDRNSTSSFNLKHITTPGLPFYIITLIVVSFTLYIFYNHQRLVASNLGFDSSLSSIVFANRYYAETNTPSHIKLLLTISKVLTYFVMFMFLNNLLIVRKMKKAFMSIIIFVIYLLCCALTTNRIDLINIASALIFMLIFLWKKGNDINVTKYSGRKLLLSLVVVFASCLLLFRMFGYLTGKSEMYNVYDNISIYIGSPLVCLDKYITGNSGISDGFHIQLLNHLYQSLNQLGFGIKIEASLWPFQYWAGGASNIYSSIFPYLVKFGFVGTFFLEFFIGVLMGFIESFLVKKSNNMLVPIICANFFYILTMYSIAERFFDQLFTVTSLIEILSIVFIWLFLSKMKKNTFVKRSYGLR